MKAVVVHEDPSESILSWTQVALLWTCCAILCSALAMWILLLHFAWARWTTRRERVAPIPQEVLPALEPIKRDLGVQTDPGSPSATRASRSSSPRGSRARTPSRLTRVPESPASSRVLENMAFRAQPIMAELDSRRIWASEQRLLRRPESATREAQGEFFPNRSYGGSR